MKQLNIMIIIAIITATVCAYEPTSTYHHKNLDKKIFIIDSCTPQPDRDSGSMRMFNIMQTLVQEGWKVYFYAHNNNQSNPYVTMLQELGVNVLCSIIGIKEWLKSNGRQLSNVLLSHYCIAEQWYKVVRTHAPEARIIFDTVDLNYVRMSRQAELTGNRQQYAAAQRVKQRELTMIKKCDITLVVSDIERTLMHQELPGCPVAILSNIHEVVGCKRSFEQRKDLFFVGSFGHEPNVDAMIWFITDIWPMIAQRIPEAVFHIVGKPIHHKIKALESERIIIHGPVKDLTPFLDGCRLAVAPLRFGAGIKGKVNQSMSRGQPVVATSIAAEGMFMQNGQDVLIADTPQEFAQAVIQLYNDKELWQTVSFHGPKIIEQYFSFDAARKALQTILKQ